MTCSGTDDPTAVAPRPLRGRSSLTAAFTRSYLSFEGRDDATFDRWAWVAGSDLYFGRFTLSLSAGGLLDAAIDTEVDGFQTQRAVHALEPGWLASAGLSWRVLDDKAALPYIVLTASIGGAHAATRLRDERGDYIGLDFRFGATLGKTFFGWFSPYTALRVFGGPIFWVTEEETKLGTDKFHFQAGLGAVFILPENVDLFIEGQPGAEQGAFGGVGFRY